MSVADEGDAARRCTELVARCATWKKQQAWEPLRAEASQALELATALGRHGDRALTAHLLANAHTALDDRAAAERAYRTSIEAAAIAGNRHLLAVGHGNFANLLRDDMRLDEALEHYEHALEFEDAAVGRSQVRLNEARALALQGELRSALAQTQACIDELERGGVTGGALAIALGQAAIDEIELGAPREALALLDRARGATAPEDDEGLAANSLQRVSAQLALGDRAAAAQAFADAHRFAVKRAKAQLEPPRDQRYRAGFERARATALPLDNAMQLLMPGVAAKTANNWPLALQLFDAAHLRARQAGDHALALRILINAVATYADARRIDEERQLLEQVLQEAGERGLAMIEAMALANRGVIIERTGELHVALGALGQYVRAAELTKLHMAIVSASSLPPDQKALETAPARTRTVDNQLAKLARRCGADALAAQWFEDAAAAMRPIGVNFELVNRLAGALDALDAAGAPTQAVADEITASIATPGLPPLARLVGERALGNNLARSDSAAAASHLRVASDIGESLRQLSPRGPMRSEANRDYTQLNANLAYHLRRAGDLTAAYEALQRGKGRRILDVLAFASGTEDTAPTLAQVQACLKPDDVLIDLALEEHGAAVYVLDTHELRSLAVEGDAKLLARVSFGDVEEREAGIVRLVREDPLLLRLAAELSAAVPARCRLLIVPDGLLHNLPLHAITIDGVPLCERYPIGYLPAAGVLRIARHTASRQALVAGDSAFDLPFAAAESRRVADLLGTRPIVGEGCTREAIEGVLREAELDVVHLALHGRGDPRNGGRASLLLADGAGGNEWVAFDELAALRWRANLVVFSGCSTGVAGPRAGHELASVARAALEAGAASVLACLWPVGDATASAFMIAFHEALARERVRGPVDLRTLVDEARSALQRQWSQHGAMPASQRRDGPRAIPRSVAGVADAALAWAPFVLLGEPYLPARNSA